MVDGDQALDETLANLRQLMQRQLAFVKLTIGQSAIGKIFH
jgi:hypothetical protein